MEDITTGEYVEFKREKAVGRKTYTVFVSSNKTHEYLGTINWYSGWRRYVYHPADDTFYDEKCLKEITIYIKGLMEIQKAINA